MEEGNGSTATKDVPKANVPPTVITVDAAPKEADSTTPSKASNSDAASQARTPKHANTNQTEDSKFKQEEKGTKEAESEPSVPPTGGQPHPSGAQGNYNPNSNFPQRQFDGRMGGSGAFQPHERPSYPPSTRGLPPMQVSPGSGRYYGYSGPPNRYGPPPPQYDQQQQQHFQGPSSFQQQRPPPYGQPPVYHPSQAYPSGSYDTSGPSWGPPPSFPQHGRPPTYPSGAPMPPQEYARRQHQQPQQQQQQQQQPTNTNSSGSFSRAVSSSFDRSIKSKEDKPGTNMDVSPHLGPSDNASTGDASWGQLNQVASVDEDEMRKRLERKAERKKDVAVTRSAGSNSSSLTNSPTGEGQKQQQGHAKLPSSLDSLSSVASAQAPMDTSKHGRKSLSPNEGSAGSLDLMKCPSGSSALLLPSHQRTDSHFSFSGGQGKRPHEEDEERGDMDTTKTDSMEIRKAPSGEVSARPTKKGRIEKDKKSSPLSIECSPPTSPSGQKRKSDAKVKQPKAGYHKKEPSSGTSGMDSFYDKEPSYTYSMDSAPPMPRDAHLPARPGSTSSTITPMNVDGSGPEARNSSIAQLPSWDIQPQDSFGGTSNGGGALMSTFSFTQDYPMLGASSSQDQGHVQQPSQQQQQHQAQNHPSQAAMLESRNQSFEGGHYHGSFSRSDSMMSYEGHPPPNMPFDARGGYHGPFPPHAPSWGSASSYPQGHPGYGQFQNYPPPMMRNFSEDSGARTSPPTGPPHGMRVMHRGFQPPPEFRAPPSMVSKSGPQTQHIISSPYGGKSGSYGWSKEEDMRLTEIMKKYKNPRDWEPIAKEHNCGRSAKECHERWIRYLKPGVRKGQWTDHEDAIVMEVVTTSSEQPFTRWSDLAQRLPGRVGKQIRDRWVNHLNPNINHLPFSREDDLLLWEGHKKLGKRWVEISTKYFNSTRSENHIKNRWYSASFKKFIANEFGPDAYTGGKSNKKDSPKKKKEKASSPSKRQQSTQSGSVDDTSQIEAV